MQKISHPHFLHFSKHVILQFWSEAKLLKYKEQWVISLKIWFSTWWQNCLYHALQHFQLESLLAKIYELFCFPGILREALSVCCFSCTKLRFLPAYKTTTEAIMMFGSSTVVMPWVTSSSAMKVAGDIFIAVMPTRGVVYVTSLEMSMIHFQKFATSISSNWPLFCISLILAVDAGIIVWLLVSKH